MGFRDRNDRRDDRLAEKRGRDRFFYNEDKKKRKFEGYGDSSASEPKRKRRRIEPVRERCSKTTFDFRAWLSKMRSCNWKERHLVILDLIKQIKQKNQDLSQWPHYEREIIELLSQQIVEITQALTDVLSRGTALKERPSYDYAFQSPIYLLAKSAEHNLLAQAIPTEFIEKILVNVTALISKEEHRPYNLSQNLSLILWSIAKLAEAGRISQDYQISYLDILPLLHRLKEDGVLSSQNLGQSIWALGKLAEESCLAGLVNWSDLKSLFEKLYLISHSDSQAMGECLWALGKLAEKNYFEDKVHWSALKPLFEKLSQIQPPNSHAIGMALWSLGKLVQKDCFEGSVSWFEFMFLFRRLCEVRTPIAQDIGEFFWSLGKLAEKNYFKDKVYWSELKPLFETLYLIQSP